MRKFFTNKKAFGRTGLMISTITYGGIVSTMDGFQGYTYEGNGQEASDCYVEYALENGVNYFDVAPSYGDAEKRLGNSLIGKRDKIVLACKTGQRDYDAAAREFEQTLKYMHTDVLDVYQLHGISHMEEVDRVFAEDGAMKLLWQMKEQGVVRNLGITAHSEKAALDALSRYDFDTILFPFNWQMYLGFGYGKELLETAKSRNMGILCMKSMIERAFLPEDPVARKKYPKSWCKPFDFDEQQDLLLAAMKFSLSLGVNTLIPAGNIDHFRFAIENHKALENEPFNGKDAKLLFDHLKTVIDHPFMVNAD